MTPKSCWDGVQLSRQEPKDLRIRFATISQVYIITEGLLFLVETSIRWILRQKNLLSIVCGVVSNPTLVPTSAGVR